MRGQKFDEPKFGEYLGTEIGSAERTLNRPLQKTRFIFQGESSRWSLPTRYWVSNRGNSHFSQLNRAKGTKRRIPSFFPLHRRWRDSGMVFSSLTHWIAKNNSLPDWGANGFRTTLSSYWVSKATKVFHPHFILWRFMVLGWWSPRKKIAKHRIDQLRTRWHAC